MSVSMSQASDARIFLSSYRNSLDILKRVALQQVQSQKYDSFLNRIIEAKSLGHFNGHDLLQEGIVKKNEVVAFQLSYGLFLKYFTCLNKPNQSFEQLISCIQNNIPK